MDPLRGEVWDAQFPRIGAHPAVVLTISSLIPKLSAVTVALVTGTEGPQVTHVRLGAEVGLSGHEVSYANATDLHTLPKAKLRRRRGVLHPAELTRLEQAARSYLGL